MQKSLDYGFGGYQVPRATRSARGKGSSKKYGNGNQMCAFDLLATIAGKLLCEQDIAPANCDSTSERSPDSIIKFNCTNNNYLKENVCAPTALDSSSSVSNERIKPESGEDVKPLKLEVCDQGSSDECPLDTVGGLHQQISHAKKNIIKEVLNDNNEGASVPFSVLTKSVPSARACGNLVFEVGNVSGGSFGVRDRREHEVDMLQGEQIERKRKWGLLQEHTRNICGSGESFDTDNLPPALVISESSDEGPFCIQRPRAGSLPVCREDIKLVNKDDDDENSYECSQPSSISMKGYKIRNSLSSKPLKETPAVLKDGISFNNDRKKPSHHSKRANHKRQRTQRCLSFKRRQLCEENSSLTSHGEICSEGVSNMLKQRTCEGTHDPASRTDQVKLSIKSFKVPELLIEMPETATIRTLKRYVVEAVTSMLEGGVQVGVLLQGRKMVDDTKMLCETCLSCGGELDGVHFLLEPNTAVHSPKLCSTDPCVSLSSQQTQPLNRHNPLSENSDITSEGLTIVGSVKPVSCSSEESNCDQNRCPPALSPKEEIPNSLALIHTPITTVDALAVVPVNRKPQHVELAQRRIRRPFSVSEVESLVKSVEKLGTGRWRDVKILSFDNAKHRTYVDLKDKWKTLVHTARISPHQRRGEPVPQELLERVLAAHAYWSQQQSKHHQVKQRTETRANSFNGTHCTD